VLISVKKKILMLNKLQIKLVQMAVRGAGIRTAKCDARYRMLLSQYKAPNGTRITSCKQLNNSQLEDLLAICEAYGWRMPGKEETYFRDKVSKSADCDIASFAQQSAIKNLAGDLGWDELHLANFLRRQTGGTRRDDDARRASDTSRQVASQRVGSATAVSSISLLSHRQAWSIIEALKAIIGKETGKRYTNLRDIKEDFTEVTDGKTSQVS
jgi:hypothetical protein